MNKLVQIVAITMLVIAASMVIAPLAMGMPVISRPMGLIDATIEGSPPQSVDYSWAYDTASGEILLNTMDTLIQYAGESTSSYIGDIATSWTGNGGGLNGNAPIRLDGSSGITLADGHGGIDSGIPISGLWFENNGQGGVGAYTPATGDATYYYQYVFHISAVALGLSTFWPAYTYNGHTINAGPLTLQDIVYSFERSLVNDRNGGPQWMLDEPLLDNAAGLSQPFGGLAAMGYTYTPYKAGGNTPNYTQVGEVGQLIAGAIVANPTLDTITFNIMYPGIYPGFTEILTQTWASIMREDWINTIAIGAYGRSDWNGQLAGTYDSCGVPYTIWLSNWLGSKLSPLDVPYFITYGSGPFILQTVDLTNNYWSATRNGNYWRGWPATFPTQAGAQPAGYVNTIEVTWNFVWGTRLTMFEHGDCDYCGVGDNSQLPQMFTNPSLSAWPGYPFDTSSSNYPLPGIQCVEPLTELEVDAMFYTFEISAPVLQPLCAEGTYSPTAIPPDFFGTQVNGVDNATWAGWSNDIRSAFAYCFDYKSYINQVFLGLASQPATAIIQGLNDWNPNQASYYLNLTAAKALLQKTPVWTTGFTLNLYYNTGNTARLAACILEQKAIESISPSPGLFTVNVYGIPWATYLDDMLAQQVPMFSVGWLADFPDASDFAFPFYDSAGAYGAWQALPQNWPMNTWVSQAVQAATPAIEQTDYYQIQSMAISLCPSFATDQPIGYHFQRDWVQGYYYNDMYPGPYFYNQWKWYYTPQAQLSSTPTGTLSEYNSADINYDGVIDISDVATAAAAFGSYAAPMSSNWIFRADVTNDRLVDISDIAYIASLFGSSSTPWSTQLSISVSPSTTGLPNATGQTVTLTASTAFGTAPLTYNWYEISPTPGLVHGPDVDGTTDTWTFTPNALGTYTFDVTVNNGTYTATSNIAYVYVGPQVSISTVIGTLTANFNVTASASVNLDAVANGGTTPYTYNWLYSETSPTARGLLPFPDVVNGASSLTFDNTVMNSTNLLDIPGQYNIFCNVTDSAGLWVLSNAVLLNVTK